MKGILGAETSTPNWSVIRECGQKPQQFQWFRAAARSSIYQWPAPW